MKVLLSIKAYALLVWRSVYFKYAVVCIVGVLLVGFLDDNSLWSHFKNRQRIAEAVAGIDERFQGRRPKGGQMPVVMGAGASGILLHEAMGHAFEADFNRDQAQIKELDRNPKAIEKIARERYFMKADDEDIFVLSDDDRDVKPLETNERVE